MCAPRGAAALSEDGKAFFSVLGVIRSLQWCLGGVPWVLSCSLGVFSIPKLGWGTLVTQMASFNGHLSKELLRGAVELPGVGAGGPQGGDITPGLGWCHPNAFPALGPTSCTITSVSFCLKMAFCALKCV